MLGNGYIHVDNKADASGENVHEYQVFFGLEYESLDGRRLIANSADLNSSSTHTNSIGGLFGRNIPLYIDVQSTDDTRNRSIEGGHVVPFHLALHLMTISETHDLHAGRKRESQFQLQRVFMVTPDPPVLFSTKPRITFDHAREHIAAASLSPTANHETSRVDLHFILGSAVVLPANSFCVLKLPFVYGAPSKWFGMPGVVGRLDCTSGTTEDWLPLTSKMISRNANIDSSSLLCPL